MRLPTRFSFCFCNKIIYEISLCEISRLKISFSYFILWKCWWLFEEELSWCHHLYGLQKGKSISSVCLLRCEITSEKRKENLWIVSFHVILGFDFLLLYKCERFTFDSLFFLNYLDLMCAWDGNLFFETIFLMDF